MAKSNQTLIPGSDRDVINEIEEQAAKYQEAKEIRMQCTAAEVAEKKALHEAMVKAELREYRTKKCNPPLLVEIKVTEEKVSTTIIPEPKTGVIEPGGKGKNGGSEVEVEASATH